MLEGNLDSWGSSSEERVEKHRAVWRCMRVLALLAGGGTAEMMPISHFIKFLRGTFSMKLLLSSIRESGQISKMCLNIYKSPQRVHWSWILNWCQFYFTSFPEGKLFCRVWNVSLEDIPRSSCKDRFYSHTLSVEETTECKDLKYLEFDLDVGKGIR